MAINRMTDIVGVMKSKWTYGDAVFGYNEELNDNHDTKYPLMIITPPQSVIPVVSDGWEEYDFEVNFFNLYKDATKKVVSIEKRWDNLQDLAMEWLDMLIKNYQDTNGFAYLEDESVSFERLKEVGNDMSVEIKLTFTLRAFTKCFRPQSNYPTDYDGCVLWLKADSGVDFSIPTKKVSVWADQSGNNNDFSVSIPSKQPYRYGYDGANDKTYINFKENKSIESDANSTLGADFTIFTVANSTNLSDIQPFFSYSSARENIIIGSKNGFAYVEVEDDDSIPNVWIAGGGAATDYTIIRADLDGSTGDVNVQRNNDSIISATIAGWSGVDFNSRGFYVGYDGTNYLDGNVEEVIVFNRVLTDSEIKDIKGYLNNKYNIY